MPRSSPRAAIARQPLRISPWPRVLQKRRRAKQQQRRLHRQTQQQIIFLGGQLHTGYNTNV